MSMFNKIDGFIYCVIEAKGMFFHSVYVICLHPSPWNPQLAVHSHKHLSDLCSICAGQRVNS